MLHLKEGANIKIGQKIRVYRNLHKDLFSIQDYKTKKVIAHGDGILIKDVNFIIHKKGQEKVRNTLQKGVHAFVVGSYYGVQKELSFDFSPIYYNPYKTDFFIDLETSMPVHQTFMCLCLNNMCYIK